MIHDDVRKDGYYTAILKDDLNQLRYVTVYSLNGILFIAILQKQNRTVNAKTVYIKIDFDSVVEVLIDSYSAEL